jgi:hypothetical protein
MQDKETVIFQFLRRQKLNAKIVLTLVMEMITLFFRFGLGLQSTLHTASTIGRLTFGIRIHHGYIGVLLLCINAVPAFSKNRFSALVTIIGASLFLSDVIHHSLLYLVTGSADLDLVYPEPGR